MKISTIITNTEPNNTKPSNAKPNNMNPKKFSENRPTKKNLGKKYFFSENNGVSVLKKKTRNSREMNGSFFKKNEVNSPVFAGRYSIQAHSKLVNVRSIQSGLTFM